MWTNQTNSETILTETEMGLVNEAVRKVSCCGNSQTGAFYDPDDGLPLFYPGEMVTGDGRLPDY